MIHPFPDAPEQTAHIRVAFLTALFVGLCGLYPHLRWSFELRQFAWFYNSYDEGYYGWLSMKEMSADRGLSGLVMHVLYMLSGANTQRAMVLADFLLPTGVTLASCYLVRPLFANAKGMAAGALTVALSAECLALRSTSIPYSTLNLFLQEKWRSMATQAADVLQLANQTSTFWIFRTPEPQVSWIMMFILLGLALRLIQIAPTRLTEWRLFGLVCFLAGFCYLFCALSLSCAFLLFSLLMVKSHSRSSVILGTGGLLCFITCTALSTYVARQSGGESLVFISRRPVIMLSVILGALAVAWTLVFAWVRREFNRTQLFSIALGLTPLCMTNQQMVTGHMIYLSNFENFGLAQVSALALLIAICSPPVLQPKVSEDAMPRKHASRFATVCSCLVVSFLGCILVRSQVISYDNYLAENRLGRSYEMALRALSADGALIACDDFFQQDTLAVRLGQRPPFLVSRDMAFSKPIWRLKNPQEMPGNGVARRQALYQYLSLAGVSSKELSQKFKAITDPEDPNWQDRFMLGGFLYNHADFWAPLTHGRDTKLNWIADQKAMIMEDYIRYTLRGNRDSLPVIFVMRQDKPTPSSLLNRDAQLLMITPASWPIPIKAYRVYDRPVR